MTIQDLLKNKTAVIAFSIGLFILILVIVLSPKKNVGAPTSGPADESQTRTELIDLSQEKRRDAMVYTASVEKKLPLYLEKFETSVGITTSINIYRLDDDEAEVVRLEIYGLSYLNSESNPVKNPNVIAFKESYLKALEMIEAKNIDPKKLIFIYGDKEYIRTTSEAWIEALKLLP